MFLRSLIGYSNSGYLVLFTDSPSAPPYEANLTSKMASLFAGVPNGEISQIIKEAVTEKDKEGDKIRFGSFNR